MAVFPVALGFQGASRVLGFDQLEKTIEPLELLPSFRDILAIGRRVQSIHNPFDLLDRPFEPHPFARFEVSGLLDQRLGQLGQWLGLFMDVAEFAALDVARNLQLCVAFFTA